MDALRLRLEKQNDDLAKMTIRAPRPGLVHYGDPRRTWYRDEVKVGNRVYRGRTLITLPDLTDMEVMIKIHEADIDKIEMEQVAHINLDTYAGQTFTGKVTQIASVATSSGWDSNTKAFDVTVMMDPSETKLRAGISAKVEIQVARIEDALHAPLQAVFVEEGKHFCFVWKDGNAERRAIQVGRNKRAPRRAPRGRQRRRAVAVVRPARRGQWIDRRIGRG